MDNASAPIPTSSLAQDPSMKLPAGNVIAVGGGKGGVGKSFLASNLACGLARRGRSVILVDADLGGANIHLLFGIKFPGRTLGDFLEKKVPAFSDILLPTLLPNLSLICGASDILELANPNYAQKKKLIGEIAKLKADTIIIDIGAGANLNNLDFFNSAERGIIVTTPSPTALQNAYGFLKLAVHRDILNLFSGEPAVKKELTTAFADASRFKSMKQVLDFLEGTDSAAAQRVNTLLSSGQYRLVVNMATEKEGERVAKALSGVAYQYLSIHLASLGVISYDPDVENSIRKMEPLLLKDGTAVSVAITRMIRKLIEDQPADTPPALRSAEGGGATAARPGVKSGSRVQLALHDEVLSQGTKLHVQTEDLGLDKARIVTLVFTGGRILHTRDKEYRDILARDDIQQLVAERVNAQHRAMLADIRGGLLAGELLAAKGL